MKSYWWHKKNISFDSSVTNFTNKSKKCVCGHHENEHYGSGNGHVCAVIKCRCCNSIYIEDNDENK